MTRRGSLACDIQEVRPDDAAYESKLPSASQLSDPWGTTLSAGRCEPEDQTEPGLVAVWWEIDSCPGPEMPLGAVKGR